MSSYFRMTETMRGKVACPMVSSRSSISVVTTRWYTVLWNAGRQNPRAGQVTCRSNGRRRRNATGLIGLHADNLVDSCPAPEGDWPPLGDGHDALMVASGIATVGAVAVVMYATIGKSGR